MESPPPPRERVKITKQEKRWSKVLPVRVSCICIILGNFMEKNYISFRK